MDTTSRYFECGDCHTNVGPMVDSGRGHLYCVPCNDNWDDIRNRDVYRIVTSRDNGKYQIRYKRAVVMQYGKPCEYDSWAYASMVCSRFNRKIGK